MIISRAEWAGHAAHECDVAVVGSGAAGISMALELARLGVKCILLEGGGASYTEESQDCYGGYVDKRDLPYGLKNSRLRFLGGSTNCWAGGCGEFDEQDFLHRAWIPYSGWPLRKQDLDSDYRNAAKFLEIDIQRLRSPGELAGLPAFKGFELRSLEFTPKVRFATEFGDRLKQAPLIRLFSDANLTGLERSAEGDAVSALTIQSFDGGRSRVKAKACVLACGGIENARILLNSGAGGAVAFGNRTDRVGRFFCDHPIAPCATVVGPSGELKDMKFEARHFYKQSDGGAAGVPFFRLPFELQQQYATLNATLQFHLQEPEMGPGEVAAWRLRNYIRDPARSTISADDLLAIAKNPVDIVRTIINRQDSSGGRLAMRFQMEQSPNPDSRITLVDEQDKLGVRRARLSWSFTEIERRTVDVMNAYAAACLQREGIGTLRMDRALDENRLDLPMDLRGGQHHSGTTRMAASEKDGVVDTNLKVFQTRNLFVCGSSVFPTNGWVNPTMTIVALSLRLARHLAKEQLPAGAV